jgi:hypothetical protein
VAGNAILSFADIASAAELQSLQLSKPQPQTDSGKTNIFMSRVVIFSVNT